MSRETLTHLNTQTLIGYTDKRGNAWHYREALQGAEPNHYPAAIPVADVTRRLFDWKPVVGAVQTVILDETGVETITDATRQANIRPDTKTILGVFSKGYRIHDYSQWLVTNVEAILDTGDLAIGSAGLLRGGAVAWVQIEMEDTLSAEGVDYRPFLTAATSLDGSLATTYQVGSQVVVCDNTLSAALGEHVNRVKIRHSRHSLGKLTDVRQALKIVHGVGDSFAAAVQELCAETVTEARWEAFVDAYTGRDDATISHRARGNAEDKAAVLHRLWSHDTRVAPWRGTAWGVVAAANTYLHHEAKVRGADRATRNTERVVTGQIDAYDANTLRVLASV
jgi:phage/plasmid-like protein (TIGR03299 family)